MDNTRFSPWSQTISSIIRKTDVNIVKLSRSESVYIDHSRTNSMRPCFEQQDHNDISSYIRNELDNFKIEIEHTLNRTMKRELNSLEARVGSLENSLEDNKNIHFDIGKSLSHLQTNFLVVNGKLENSLKESITRSTLKSLEDSLKTSYLHQISSLELQLNQLQKSLASTQTALHTQLQEQISEVLKQHDPSQIQSELVMQTNSAIEAQTHDILCKVDQLTQNALSQYIQIEKDIKSFQNYILERDPWAAIDHLKSTLKTETAALKSFQETNCQSLIVKLGELELRVTRIEAEDSGLNYSKLHISDQELQAAEDNASLKQNISSSYYIREDVVIHEDSDESLSDKDNEMNEKLEEFLSEELEIAFEVIESVVDPSSFGVSDSETDLTIETLIN